MPLEGRDHGGSLESRAKQRIIYAAVIARAQPAAPRGDPALDLAGQQPFFIDPVLGDRLVPGGGGVRGRHAPPHELAQQPGASVAEAGAACDQVVERQPAVVDVPFPREALQRLVDLGAGMPGRLEQIPDLPAGQRPPGEPAQRDGPGIGPARRGTPAGDAGRGRDGGGRASVDLAGCR